MQINIYGNPGDGKSYSAIHYVALFSVAEKIVWGSNIEGVNPVLISSYLNFLASVDAFRSRPKRPPDVFSAELAQLSVDFPEFALLNVDRTGVPKLSRTEVKILVVMKSAGTNTGTFDFTQYIKVVDYAAVEKADFWYTAENGVEKPNAVMQPGECWTIDESRRYFGAGKLPPIDALKCINEHRHYVNADGRSIALYFIAQHPTQLSKDAKQNCQFTYHARRFLSAGKFKEKMFRLDYYEGAVGPTELKKKMFYDGMEDTLNPRIFKLYLSVNGATGFETRARAPTVWDVKMWGVSLFKVVLPLCVPVVIFAAYKMFIFFTDNPLTHKKPVGSHVSAPAAASATPRVQGVASASFVAPATASATNAASLALPAGPVDSSRYRLVGLYSQNALTIAVLADAAGRLRYVSDFTFLATGRTHEIIYQNEIVAYYTGTQNEKITPPPASR